MQTNAPSLPQPRESSGFKAAIALFLILVNALKIQALLTQMGKDDRINGWDAPREWMLALVAPTFSLVCILVIWIIARRRTAFNRIFKIASIISVLLYLAWLVLIAYISALGSAFAH